MTFVGWGFDAAVTGGVTVLCAVWWMTEALPIPVTAFIPLSVLPLLGVLSRADLASAGEPHIPAAIGSLYPLTGYGPQWCAPSYCYRVGVDHEAPEWPPACVAVYGDICSAQHVDVQRGNSGNVAACGACGAGHGRQ